MCRIGEEEEFTHFIFIALNIYYHILYNMTLVTLSDFKTYYKVIVTKTMWHWLRDRQVSEQNRVQTSTYMDN